ncbi:MAG: DNA internalization-related competence protein ComEC/Rec2 [Deltaproteobacteria bacterium CG12_big_fil_rev_8_21_14_0_65_43_10]|nr:MAG: DNA internalization-related competence protein ComEC/Rec2 [Deltaproteobacteria bacterium CG12_big_fil_rev_8_21_14_0_65_43_10]PIU85138.1 MAG: DNA internalization-related competence protein ComEC/Rec2 [Deltaproteobacteria bacterium CG06_land_8_20_14_3_00_44_19]PIX26666.1 MAG: DNA internalization-related competence protein ComEC/Rec2 [Deltaproteobacteria bacterium CG_4_8_14_3_um_filter_43_13]PIZ21109.1 MAG: DNA internalization-related competence protein ComEC/Rec2 [Deltaproteobacteria bacte
MMHRPLITLLISYLLGLLLGNYLYLSAKPTLTLIAALLLIFLGAILLNWKGLGIILFPVVFVLIGSLMMNLHTFPSIPHNHISKLLKDEGINVQGSLYEPPKLLLDRSRLYINAERVYSKRCYTKVTGKILLTIGGSGSDLKYGDRVRFICKLHRARNFGNPGGFDYSRHLALQGIFVTGYLKSSMEIIRIGEGESNYFWKTIEGFREKIRNFIDKEPKLPNRAIIKALLLGETGEIPEETRDNFTVTGLAHILAISGLHMAFIALVASIIIRGILRYSERLILALDINKVAAILTIFPVLFYGFIAGLGVSTLRATIMIVTFLIAIVIDRQRDLYNTLSTAAFIITVISPASIFDVSFQLSFVSVLAILYLTPKFLHYLSLVQGLPAKFTPSVTKVIGRYTGSLVLVSITATMGTAPIVAYHFNRVALLGFIPNIVIVPLVGFIIVPLCLLIAIMIFISPSLAPIFLRLDSVIAGFAVDMVRLFTHLPGVSFWVTTPTLLEITLFYLFIVFLFNVNRLKMARYIALVLLAIIIGDYSYWYYTKNFNRNLRVTFLSVGQGDSALIEFPKGKRMIIDGGGGGYNDSYDTGRHILAPFLWKEKIERVDYLLLSHPHPDHLNGLRFIAKNFEVKEIWTNGQSTDMESYLELMEIVNREGIKKVTVNVETLPKYINGVRVDIYNPPVQLFQGEGMNIKSSFNNNSVVVKLRFKEVSLLFTGDVEEEAEKKLVQLGSRLESTVIKVPHHGSLRSNTEEFLGKVHPSYAVFSVGYKNRFGFPKMQVLERYRDLDSRTYRTDTDGAITMVTDGVSFRVEKFL